MLRLVTHPHNFGYDRNQDMKHCSTREVRKEHLFSQGHYKCNMISTMYNIHTSSCIINALHNTHQTHTDAATIHTNSQKHLEYLSQSKPQLRSRQRLLWDLFSTFEQRVMDLLGTGDLCADCVEVLWVGQGGVRLLLGVNLLWIALHWHWCVPGTVGGLTDTLQSQTLQMTTKCHIWSSLNWTILLFIC